MKMCKHCKKMMETFAETMLELVKKGWTSSQIMTYPCEECNNQIYVVVGVDKDDIKILPPDIKDYINKMI